MIGVEERDKDVLRFLWVNNPSDKEPLIQPLPHWVLRCLHKCICTRSSPLLAGGGRHRTVYKICGFQDKSVSYAGTDHSTFGAAGHLTTCQIKCHLIRYN